MTSQPSITHPSIRSLLEHYRTIWALNHLTALGHWDLNTYMPEEGAMGRAEALSKVATLAQRLFLEETFVKNIEAAGNETNLNEYERALVRLLQRTLKFYQRLPPAFIEEFTRVTNEAHLVWKHAKKTNNFAHFRPYLERIVALARQKATYLGYKNHPYDALLDEFEEGLTTAEVERYFADIKTPLVALVQRIKKSPRYLHEHALENESYETEKMHLLTSAILRTMHYNLNHLRIDISPHPFSTSLGPGDARITTRYEGKNFAFAYGSTIHEYGHALYEIQSSPELNYTPLAGGTSLVIHESQSRFWENVIGRSREFIGSLYPDLQSLGDNFASYSLDDMYQYLNLVKPGMIRVEADEVTYHLHVLIRFEIEKALIEGTLAVADLPRVWSEKYYAYLGVIPKTDSEGVLQDVHWSNGAIGYFPTYSMGTALSLMWKHQVEKDCGAVSSLVGSKEGLRKIQEWLKHHIHQHGSTYVFRDLVRTIVGEPFTSRYLLDYLEQKYTGLYPL